MPNYSKPSFPVFCINVPEAKSVTCNFTYNYYTEDEAVNENSGVSTYFLQKDPDQIDTTLPNFNLRVPRFVKISWELPTTNTADIESSTDNYFSNIQIKKYINKITSEDKFLSSNFISYTFSQLKAVEDAYKNINQNVVLGQNQSNVVDNFVASMMENVNGLDSSSKLFDIKNELAEAIETIQAIGGNQNQTYNLNFYDDHGNLIPDTTGFAQALANNKVYLTTQINSSLIPNVFANTQVPVNIQNQLNNFYTAQSSKGRGSDFFKSIQINPILVEESELTGNDALSASTSTKIIGYLIDRYELTDNGFVKNKSFIVENANNNTFVDVAVKYSTIYFYSVSTIAAVRSPGFIGSLNKIKYATYLIASKPKINYVRCIEAVPPPPPVDVNFVWDYKRSKLQIVWGMPPNPQRDIKQFQVFRRASIHEPFELIKQKSFDFSSKKYLTGEKIDGNSLTMTQDEASFVDYENTPSMHYVDDDFSVDIDMLTSSKYIYTICSIDAHGYSSTYSSQFEVTFDFFKNVLVKKLISVAGAPKPYPNLKLNLDLFKDVIKVSGQSSKKMKIYFKPQCYKLMYNNGLEQRVILPKQEGAFYLMQFINLENQKSDKLKIEINDPQSFTI